MIKPLLLFPLLLAFSSATRAESSSSQLTGTLHSPQHLTRLVAVDRQSADPLKTSAENPKDPFLYEANLDPATGKFSIPNLLPSHSYDLIAWTTDTHGQTTRWEGVNMDYHRPINPASPLTDADRSWLENFVKDMPSFYDKSRVLHMAADHQHATLLVELTRTRDFHSEKGGKGGEIIYRAELWYFENLFGGWNKDKNTEKVLVRWRGNGTDLPKNWQFLPQLGALSPSDTPLKISLPDSPDPQNGLAAP
ncbi:MAG TPA: hypothetical protein VM008_13060 [Phycisphaerae bacterium]|nr:hypothetical protein [Phycisphaerae bacterium]